MNYFIEGKIIRMILDPVLKYVVVFLHSDFRNFLLLQIFFLATNTK